mmetsp:Transcript_17213/g.43196  ORF Transcript_17213/g.43196 Transcript_17213/m.43196 type:complete len:254 (-) Transcript_17213:603-1364(-)
MGWVQAARDARACPLHRGAQHPLMPPWWQWHRRGRLPRRPCLRRGWIDGWGAVPCGFGLHRYSAGRAAGSRLCLLCETNVACRSLCEKEDVGRRTNLWLNIRSGWCTCRCVFEWAVPSPPFFSMTLYNDTKWFVSARSVVVRRVSKVQLKSSGAVVRVHGLACSLLLVCLAVCTFYSPVSVVKLVRMVCVGGGGGGMCSCLCLCVGFVFSRLRQTVCALSVFPSSSARHTSTTAVRPKYLACGAVRTSSTEAV